MEQTGVKKRIHAKQMSLTLENVTAGVGTVFGKQFTLKVIITSYKPNCCDLILKHVLPQNLETNHKRIKKKSYLVQSTI